MSNSGGIVNVCSNINDQKKQVFSRTMLSLIPYYKLFKLNGGYWMDDLAVMYKIIAGSFKVKENAEERWIILALIGD